MTPLVAIIGRPNVGKSTLFNRLVGGRPALVHDTPHLTRDRRYGEMDYFGREMRVVDTGGLDPEAATEVVGAGIHRQAMRAIDEADALVLVVDGRAGVSAIDHELAKQLRATGKPLFLAVNKMDHPSKDHLVHEFHELGLGDAYAISAAHGRGIDGLLEAIADAVGAKVPGQQIAERDPLFDPDPDDEAASAESDDVDADDSDADDGDDDGDGDADDADDGDADAVDADAEGDDGEQGDDADDEDGAEDGADDKGEVPVVRDGKGRKRHGTPTGPLRVAFVGRPNAGKSSLTNRLLGEERSLVHDVAGTTTDPVDAPFTHRGKEYVLVDTAGIRRKAKIDADIEKIAVSMALGQIERADVAVLVIDAGIGPAEQDARIIGKIEEAGRAIVIALNKSDLVTGDARKTELRELTKDTFHFLPWAPVVMLSAQRGDGVDRLLDVVDQVSVEHRRRIPTAQLNRFFADVIEEMPPPLHHGRAVRIHYITQGAIRPPTFILWANTPDGLAPSYKRFIANRLREAYGFRGTPLRIFIKARKDRHKED